MAFVYQAELEKHNKAILTGEDHSVVCSVFCKKTRQTIPPMCLALVVINNYIMALALLTYELEVSTLVGSHYV